ncbi:MAG TPA: porin family protein [Niastella sp.]
MKSSFYLLIAILLLSQGTFAQLRTGFGVKAGSGISTVSHLSSHYQTSGNNHWTPTAYAGIFGKVSLGCIFLQAEVLYSLRGYRKKYSLIGLDNYNGERIHYISVPLLFGIRPIKKLSIVLGVETGKVIGAWAYGDGKTKNTDSAFIHRRNYDLEAGLAWAINRKWSIEGRFLFGARELKDYIWRNGRRSIREQEGYSKVVQIGVAYQLK